MALDTQVHPKVAMGGIGGSLAVLLVWGLEAGLGLKVPAEVAAALATLSGFVAGYLTSSPGVPSA